MWVPSHVAAPHETSPVTILTTIQPAELTRSFYLFDQEIQVVDHPQLCAMIPNAKTVQDVQQAVHKFRAMCKDDQNYVVSQCYDPRKDYAPHSTSQPTTNNLMMPSSLLNTNGSMSNVPGTHHHGNASGYEQKQHQSSMVGLNNNNTTNNNIPPSNTNMITNEMLMQFMQQQQQQQQKQQHSAQRGGEMPDFPMMPQNLYGNKDAYAGGMNRSSAQQNPMLQQQQQPSSGMPSLNYPGSQTLPSSSTSQGAYGTSAMPNPPISASTSAYGNVGAMSYAPNSAPQMAAHPSSVMGSGNFGTVNPILPQTHQQQQQPLPHSANMMMASGYSMNNSNNMMPPQSLSMPPQGFGVQQPSIPFFPGNNMMSNPPMMNQRSYSRQNQGNNNMNNQHNGMYPIPGMPSKEKPGFTEEKIRRNPEPIDDLLKGVNIPPAVLEAYKNQSPSQKIVCATMPGARMTVWLREHEIPPDATSAKAKYVFCQGGIILMLKAHGSDVKDSKPVELFPKQICTHFLIHNYCSRENCLHEHHSEEQLRHLIAARYVEQKAMSKKKRHELIAGILELEKQNLVKFAEEKAARQKEREAAKRAGNNNNNASNIGQNNTIPNNQIIPSTPKPTPMPVKLDMLSDDDEEEEEKEKGKKHNNSTTNTTTNKKSLQGKRNYVVGVADDDDDDDDDDSSLSSASSRSSSDDDEDDDDKPRKKSGMSKFEAAQDDEEEERSEGEDILKRRARSESLSSSSSDSSISRSNSPPPEKRMKTENAKIESTEESRDETPNDVHNEKTEEVAQEEKPTQKEPEKKKKAPAKKNAAPKTPPPPAETEILPQNDVETDVQEKDAEEGETEEKAAPKKRGRKPGTTAKKGKK